MTKEEAVSIIEERICVTEYVESSYVDCVDIEALRMVIKALEQPERKRGKWNTYYHGDDDSSYSCNQCGYSAPYGLYGGEYSQKKWRFCPNCGSYNGGGDNEAKIIGRDDNVLQSRNRQNGH